MAGTGDRRRAAEKKTAHEKKMAEQEERIRDLEEKLARLEEEKGGAPEGTAASVLQGLGGMFPGLDRLIEGLGKSGAFQERLKAIDAEIEARLKSEPLKRVEEERGRPSARTMAGRPPPAGRRPSIREREDIAPQEPPVDIFDEETHLKVVAELPGIGEKDIKLDLSGARLVISADTLAHKYRKEIVLPCAPRGKAEKLYRNGILQITLWKE